MDEFGKMATFWESKIDQKSLIFAIFAVSAQTAKFGARNLRKNTKFVFCEWAHFGRNTKIVENNLKDVHNFGSKKRAHEKTTFFNS